MKIIRSVMEKQIQQAKEAKLKYENEWMQINGVSAIGIGMTREGSVGLVISVTKKDDQIFNRIPEKIDNVCVEIHETGELRAFGE
jgi:hypothetical protein